MWTLNATQCMTMKIENMEMQYEDENEHMNMTNDIA